MAPRGGYEIDPATPRIVHGHEPYTTPRTVHAAETPGGPAILRTLRRLLAPHTAAGRIEVRCGTPVTALLTEAGAVTGVTAAGRRERAPPSCSRPAASATPRTCSPNWRARR